MPDGTTQAASMLFDALKWVFVFILGILGFNVRRVISKVDDHEKNHVSREELDKRLEPMREQIDAIHNHLMNRNE